jgi:hypothetical protein
MSDAEMADIVAGLMCDRRTAVNPRSGFYCAGCGALYKTTGWGTIRCQQCGHLGLRGFEKRPVRVWCPHGCDWSGWNDGGELVRPTPIPGPVTVTLTVKEAAAVHLIIDQLVRLARDQLHQANEIERAASAIKAALTKAGCVLDSEGWQA